MKAMILAAGLGTRLKPLTLTKPKALLEVQGVPLLALVIERLAQHGFTEIVINAHHLADQIVTFLEQYRTHSDQRGLRLAVSRETTLLDTGGGVQYAAWFFDDGQPFLVHNVDVLTDLNLNHLMDTHRRSNAMATLAVRERKTSRYFLFDSQDQLCGWQSSKPRQTRLARTVEGPVTPLSFMGIQIISPLMFQLHSASPPFSLVEAYLQLAAAGHPINAFRADEARWMDVGRKENLDQASSLFGADYFNILNIGKP